MALETDELGSLAFWLLVAGVGQEKTQEVGQEFRERGEQEVRATASLWVCWTLIWQWLCSLVWIVRIPVSLFHGLNVCCVPALSTVNLSL